MRLPALLPLVLCALPPAVPAPAGATPPAPPTPGLEEEAGRFERIAADYAEARWRARPTLATGDGVHRYDTELERLDAAALAEWRRALVGTLDRLALLDRERLPAPLRLDARFLEGQARAALHELERDRRQERDPGLYVRIAGQAVDSLLKRSFAPLCERLRAAAARARQVGRLLAEGKRNLSRPPRLWTELAIADVDGAVAFYDRVVPQAAAACEDGAVRGALRDAAAGAARALGDFRAFLQRDLLPRSDGSYVLGPARLQDILREAELIDEPLPVLIARGREELRRLRAEFEALARRMDPGRTPRQVLEEITRQHPSAAELIDATRRQIAGVRDFVVRRNIVPIPPGEDLRVAETPLFYRQLSFASMSTPGAFEERAREAYFYVTPAEPSWPPERQEQHLRAFDRFSLENTIIHEAYPGHYVQGLYERQAPTFLRRVLQSTAYVEGWALYCERMMLEAGFDPDPRERLVMLQWALIRAARYVGSMELHARGMPFAEVVRLAREEALLEQANAEREVRRYTLDPTVMAYTYGAMALRALRQRAERRAGRAFRLGEFHRQVLAEGPLPVSLLREALEGGGTAGPEGRR